MRFPHLIETNTRYAYETSDVTKSLIEEQGRQLRPEDLSWDEDFIPTLANLALNEIAKNFAKYPLLDILIPLDRYHILELISTDLDLFLVVPLIQEEYYWKRRYKDIFGNSYCKTHEGWTWKCMYLERYIQKKLENAQPQYNDEESFVELLDLCYTYIHRLTIDEQQQWAPPKTISKKQWPHIFPVTHISFIPIFKQLHLIRELEISYGMKNVMDKYDVHMFKMDPIDLAHLGEAIMRLPLLRILRLHNSDIKYLHIKAFVQKMIYNKTLIELDLSHCKIGNMGAKCIGALIQEHTHLKVLNLKDNEISEDGAVGLGWALISPEGAYIRNLNMALNPLGHSGCMAILRALVRGPTPRELSLAACHITGITSVRIAAMLKLNSSLRSLDVSNNNMAEGSYEILNSLKRNRRLLAFEIRNANFPPKVEKELKEILKKNNEMHCAAESVPDYGFLDNIAEARIESEAARS